MQLTTERRFSSGLGTVFAYTLSRMRDNASDLVESCASVSPYFVACNKAWGHLMFRLINAAERGGPPRPLFTKSAMETPTFTPGAY